LVIELWPNFKPKTIFSPSVSQLTFAPYATWQGIMARSRRPIRAYVFARTKASKTKTKTGQAKQMLVMQIADLPRTDS